MLIRRLGACRRDRRGVAVGVGKAPLWLVSDELWARVDPLLPVLPLRHRGAESRALSPLVVMVIGSNKPKFARH